MNRNSRLPGMAFTPLHRLTQVGCLASFGDADLAFALAAEGKVLWLLGLGMAACNLTGARLGVHFALKRGSRFIRVDLPCVVIALVVKLAYDQFA